jgi:hypothetical protein
MTDYTIHNNCLDIILPDKTVKEAHLSDVEISNSTITEQLNKYTDLKDELTEYNNWNQPI